MDFKTDEQQDEYYKTNKLGTNAIYGIYFFYEQAYKKYSRKYMKIQDVFGNVNGFMEFLIFIISVINVYTDYMFSYFLFNRLVNVKKGDKVFLSNSNLQANEMKNIRSNISMK